MPTKEPTSPSSWERIKDLVEVASKIATVFLAGIAFWATQQYNQRQERQQQNDQRQQTELHQVQTIIGLFDPLASSDPKKHNLAIITVKELTANVPLAIKLCLAAASKDECATTASAFGPDSLLAVASGTRGGSPQVKQTAAAALDQQQARPDSSAGREPVASAALTTPHDSASGTGAGRTRKGWVFLGTYADSSWATRYLDFSERVVPQELAGRSLAVRKATGALNVRANLFYEPGYDRIIDVLAPGSTVTLDSIGSFAGGGYYIWARVRYQVQHPKAPASMDSK
ncbi:MAG: hypothetical protein ACJ8BF_14505 [Gemmatimonadales bacterium]